MDSTDIDKSMDTFKYLEELIGRKDGWEVYEALCLGLIPAVKADWVEEKKEEKTKW